VGSLARVNADDVERLIVEFLARERLGPITRKVAGSCARWCETPSSVLSLNAVSFKWRRVAELGSFCQERHAAVSWLWHTELRGPHSSTVATALAASR
jgi:hypothetical protein